MHDELPAPPTTDESRATGPDKRDPPRSRNGVDPPDGAPVGPPVEGRDADRDGRGGSDGADCEDDCAGGDSEVESLAYRLERLRLWRTLATLAVVVARLIRSL